MTEQRLRARVLIGIATAVIAVGAALIRHGSADSSPPATLSVSYADLDIDTVDGAAVLYHRIRVAAAQVCAIFDTRDLAHQALRRSCIDRAVVAAIATVGSPVLTDRYLARVKDPAPLSIVAAR
jgi:UrcA family protein